MLFGYYFTRRNLLSQTIRESDTNSHGVAVLIQIAFDIGPG